MITLPIVPMIVVAVGALLLAVCAGFIGGAVMRAGKRADEDPPLCCGSCTHNGAWSIMDDHCRRCITEGKLTGYKRRKS